MGLLEWPSVPEYPGEEVRLSPLRGSGEEKGILRLLPLWGLENPLGGECECSSPPLLPVLFSGSSGGRPKSSGPWPKLKPRPPRPSMASNRLCSSRDPFPRGREDRLDSPSPTSSSGAPRPVRPPRGELCDRGVNCLGGKGDLRELGVLSAHAGGGVELKTREGPEYDLIWRYLTY